MKEPRRSRPSVSKVISQLRSLGDRRLVDRAAGGPEFDDFTDEIYNPDRGQGHDRPFQTSRDWSGMADHAPPEVWIVVSTCTTQSSCLRFVLFMTMKGN